MIRDRVRIKICGMTQERDIAQAIALGVDAIGLIFYSKSARFISIAQAKKLLAKHPVFVDVVAVLVNPTLAQVDEIISELPIQWLQFHGEESPEFCSQFKKPYIKAIQATSTQAIEHLVAQHENAAAILLDTPSIQHGGTGEVFDWELIPKNLQKPLILAGGLNAANVAQAVNLYSPYAVDVCSGVEISAGVKDHGKMSQFFNALWGKK